MAPGPWTPEKDAAAARLWDSPPRLHPATDPNVTPGARELASQRLDDFRMANFVGTTPATRSSVATGAPGRKAGSNCSANWTSGSTRFSSDVPGSGHQALNDGESFGRGHHQARRAR